jgi:hypothetical protein
VLYDEDVLDDADAEVAPDGSALQYWAAKRHMASKKADPSDDEYGKSSLIAFPGRIIRVLVRG